MQVFRNMQQLLKNLCGTPRDNGKNSYFAPDWITGKLVEGIEKEVNPDEQWKLAQRLTKEILGAWSKRETIRGSDV